MTQKKTYLLNANWESDENQDTGNFYNQESIDDSSENDMISNEEAGFMAGYLRD